jgi:hypothetical protein
MENAYGDALLASEPQIAELVTPYAMISRIRIVSLPRTIACADKIMLTIVDTYLSPNQSVRELRDLVCLGGRLGQPMPIYAGPQPPDESTKPGMRSTRVSAGVPD